jgi:hypothetical protein
MNSRAENVKLRNVLKKAVVCCSDCGKKYGTYSAGCSSIWEGTCNVCGLEANITETRDYGYLNVGIERLTDLIKHGSYRT